MDKIKNSAVILLLVFTFFTPVLYAQIEVDVETGAVFSGYNDVRIPGDGGTLFSLSKDLQADSEFFYRIRLFYDFNPRHHLGVLFAPLSINSTGQLDQDLVFFGETFPAQTPLSTTWMFNSYRLVYRYDFLRRERLELGIGFTAKIRDALIRVEGDGLEAEKANVGFVPILHFRARWRFCDRVALLLDGDALAAPQGRAEDVLAALILQVNDRIELKAGYRLLEGGADNDEVYNFALIHYAAFGAVVSF
jgi:hypothetical protein